MAPRYHQPDGTSRPSDRAEDGAGIKWPASRRRCHRSSSRVVAWLPRVLSSLAETTRIKRSHAASRKAGDGSPLASGRWVLTSTVFQRRSFPTRPTRCLVLADTICCPWIPKAPRDPTGRPRACAESRVVRPSARPHHPTDGSIRALRRPVGRHRSAAARPDARAAPPRRPDHAQRRVLEALLRGGVARRARALRAVSDGLRPVRQVPRRRDPRPDLARAPGPARR